MKQTGKLLLRNEGSATAPRPSTASCNGHIDSSMYDPLSENFVVPPGIAPTPRGLALFFTSRLRTRFAHEGNPWRSSQPFKAHLRLARTLLEEVGYEHAVRAIVYAVSVASHRPSFAFVLKCAREKFSNARKLD